MSLFQKLGQHAAYRRLRKQANPLGLSESQLQYGGLAGAAGLGLYGLRNALTDEEDEDGNKKPRSTLDVLTPLAAGLTLGGSAMGNYESKNLFRPAYYGIRDGSLSDPEFANPYLQQHKIQNENFNTRESYKQKFDFLQSPEGKALKASPRGQEFNKNLHEALSKKQPEIYSELTNEENKPFAPFFFNMMGGSPLNPPKSPTPTTPTSLPSGGSGSAGGGG